MEAHQHVYFDACVLHRDISAGNILITVEGKGLLIDWDHCVKLVELNNGNEFASTRRPDRMETWQFMSAALLRNNDKCNELEDDQESCLHVLTWTALHFTNHTFSGGGTSRILRAFDEEYEDEDGVKGGDLKRGFLLAREIPHLVKFDCRPSLDGLISELTEAFAVRYEKPPSDDHIQGLRRAREDNVDLSIMRLLPAFDYQKRLDDLAAPGWLVDTFRRYINADTRPPSGFHSPLLNRRQGCSRELTTNIENTVHVVVDFQTVECAVGRVKRGNEWAIDRSGDFARTIFVDHINEDND